MSRAKALQEMNVSRPISTIEELKAKLSTNVSRPVTTIEELKSELDMSVSQPVTTIEELKTELRADVSQPVTTTEELKTELHTDVSRPVTAIEEAKEELNPDVIELPVSDGREVDSDTTVMSPEEHLVSLLAPNSFEADQFRRLRHMLEKMREDVNLSVVAVTSALAGDGKSFISTNLAGALAQGSGARVLLLDADLRGPSVHLLLGLSDNRRPGLAEIVIDEALPLSDVVLTCSEFNLAVLPAGQAEENPYEIFKSGRFKALLKEMRQHYDFIVVDMPPLLLVPDCRVLESQVDGFLIVVSANRTPRKMIEDALGELTPDKVLGIVFNQYQHLGRYHSSHYTSYYSGLAQKIGQEKGARA